MRSPDENWNDRSTAFDRRRQSWVVVEPQIVAKPDEGGRGHYETIRCAFDANSFRAGGSPGTNCSLQRSPTSAPAGAAVNSQGRKPLDVRQRNLSPVKGDRVAEGQDNFRDGFESLLIKHKFTFDEK